VKLNEIPAIEPYQGKFCVFVLVTISTISLGLVAWASFVVFSQPPFIALALVMFLFAAVVSVWGMTQFQFVLETNRNHRRTELETGIALMKENLAKPVAHQR
jgi:hypothetical protein